MRTKTRIVGQQTAKGLAPADQRSWQNLMATTLKRIEMVGENSTRLQAAYVRGQSEQALRKLGIICQADLDRLYPLK